MDGTEMGLLKQEVWPEQGVIGSMLIDPRVVGMVVAQMTEADFLMAADKLLFRTFRALFTAGKTIDPVLVLQAAAPGDDGLRSYILQLMDTTPTACNVEAYMEKARAESRKAQIRTIGNQLMEIQDEAEALALFRQGEALLSSQGRQDEVDMSQAFLEFMSDLEHTPEYLPWGLPFLDEGLDVSGGKLVVLGGRPSDGKTALALHMAQAQARTKNVGFFTLEDDRNTLFTRMMSSVSGVPMDNIFRRRLAEEEYGLFAMSGDKLVQGHLRIIESSGWTVNEIAARALLRKFDVIYVDYLQLIQPAKGLGNRQDEVAHISISLANLARRNNITVVALSQMSRPPEKTGRRKPTMAELRESGQIEQDANVIMFVWRKDESVSNTPRYLTVAKNKTGRLGTWDLSFHGDIQRFSGKNSTLQKPEIARRREPESKQMTWEELTSQDSEFPFGEEEQYGKNR